MMIREATESDLRSVAERSISHGLKEWPAAQDFVYALDDDGVVLAVGGLKLLNPMTAWCWIDLSAESVGRKCAVYRHLREWTAIISRKMGLRRLMAAVECGFDEGRRLALHLGFRRECTMTAFLGSKDADLYAMILEPGTDIGVER